MNCNLKEHNQNNSLFFALICWRWSVGCLLFGFFMNLKKKEPKKPKVQVIDNSNKYEDKEGNDFAGIQAVGKNVR